MPAESDRSTGYRDDAQALRFEQETAGFGLVAGILRVKGQTEEVSNHFTCSMSGSRHDLS